MTDNAFFEFLADLTSETSRRLALAIREAMPDRNAADMLKSVTLSLESLGVSAIATTMDRDEAAFLFRFVRDNWQGTVDGHAAHEAPGLPDSRVVYTITWSPPKCPGCGGSVASASGMCFQCEAEAHATGEFDMDTGYARV